MLKEIKDISGPRREGVFHLWEAKFFHHGGRIPDEEYNQLSSTRLTETPGVSSTKSRLEDR